MSETTEDKKSSKIFKIVIGLLIALLLAAIIFGVKNYSQLQENTAAFETEKSIKIAELKSIQAQYDNLLIEDAANKEEITAAKERLVHLMDSIKSIKPDMSVINKLRKSENYFKGQLKKLTAENEILKQQNYLLNTQKDSLSSELVTSAATNQTLNLTNEGLQELVAKAQKLKVLNVNSKATRIRKLNGKVVEVTKAKKASGFEVCFDVASNDVAERGDKILFIQVVSPNKEIIGKQQVYEADDRTLKYSKTSKFRFQNKAMNICDFVDPLDTQLPLSPGSYSINIYNGLDLIQSSSMSLK